MAEWQSRCLVSQTTQPALESVGAGPDRALQNTSGNVQTYAEGVANGDGGSHDEQLQSIAHKFPQAEPPFNSVPTSNVQDSQAMAARLRAKKLRRLQSAPQPPPTTTPPTTTIVRPRRSYMNSQKYLEYRARPRRDTGKDGEPVWSDALEDAFQQGEL